jgi:5S rRNA maturation endonuclease (ribonuclease M5)
VIYPELDRGAYCFVCGKSYNWGWLAHLIKGIPYKQACEEVGQPLADNGGIERNFKTETTQFCDDRERVFIDAYNDRHSKCSTEYPQEMVEWLEKKHLTETAKKLDWRWHDGTVFKGWGKGIVITYFKLGTKDIDYERIREWNGKGFDKPKGSFSMTIEPYFSTFRPNSVQFVVEGESDCASIDEHGCSAIGLPGAVTKKAINTVVATLNDLPFVKSVIVCGDDDDAGRTMNNLVVEAVHKIAPRLVVKPYKHLLHEKGSDMNDEHVKGILKPPVQFTANFRENYKRNYPEMEDFYQFTEDLEKRDAEAKARGETIWQKHGNIWVEKD